MAIAEIASGIFSGVVKPILDKFVVDAEQRQEAELMFFKQAHEINLGQLDVSKVEAASSDKFTSRGRPFVIWVCGAGFAYSMIVKDILNWGIAVLALYLDRPIPTLPPIDTTVMFDVLLALLGLGGYRTYEKVKGAAK